MKRYILLLAWIFLSGFSVQSPTVLSAKELVDMTLEELMEVRIVTASRSEEVLNQAPSVMSIITAKEIERFGGNNLFEVLERITSIYMTGSHLYPHNTVSIRGDLSSFVNNHVLVLLNGRPFRESYAGSYLFSLYLAFPVSMIEKIEVIRGPGSVLYGSNAFVGVVNILTKTESEENMISLKKGTYGTQAIESNVFSKSSQYKLAGGFKHSQTEGWLYSAANESGKWGEIPRKEENTGVYLYGESNGFTLSTLWVDSTQDVWFIPLEAGANINHAKRLLIDLGYQRQFSEQWTTQANLTYNQHETILDSNPFLENQRYHPSSEDVLFEWTHFIKQEKLNWLFGGTVYSMNNQLEGSPKHHGLSYSLYAQGQYELTKALRLVAGGQWIKPVDVNAHFVPRLGLIYQFSERWGAKLLYGEAFRTAFNEERFVKRPLLIGNSQLKPELIKAVDLSIFYNSRNYQLAATYFTDHEQDLIIKVPHPTIKNAYIYDNAGEISIRGLELEAKLKPTEQLFITSALTYQTNRNQEDKEDYTTVPNWMAKLGISYEFGKHSSISVFDSYFSQPGDVKVRYPDVKYLNPKPEAFHRVTLNLRTNLQPWLGQPIILTGYIYNLLNEKIYAPESERSRINSIPASAGRSFYLSLEYRFK